MEYMLYYQNTFDKSKHYKALSRIEETQNHISKRLVISASANSVEW